MKRIIAVALMVLALSGTAFCQKEIKWYTLQEALKLSASNPKKIFIDVYTDWCGWCKRMDATTFKDPMVIDYMNKYFYAVKFNAEKIDTITYKGKLYTIKPDSKVNDLAIYFLNSKMSYPTTVYLNENADLIQPIPGYRDANEMGMFLTYLGADIARWVSWENYQPIYKIIKDAPPAN
jgi:thioredoxin-related protein